MFDIASSEFLLVMLVALVVIGPKDLPKLLRVVGKWVGKARGMASQFRGHFDEMVRQSELQEMEAKWAAENERIMNMHPQPSVREYDTAPPETAASDAPADADVLPPEAPPAAEKPAS